MWDFSLGNSRQIAPLFGRGSRHSRRERELCTSWWLAHWLLFVEHLAPQASFPDRPESLSFTFPLFICDDSLLPHNSSISVGVSFLAHSWTNNRCMCMKLKSRVLYDISYTAVLVVAWQWFLPAVCTLVKQIWNEQTLRAATKMLWQQPAEKLGLPPWCVAFGSQEIQAEMK